MRVRSPSARPREWPARLRCGIGLVAVTLVAVPSAWAQDAADWLQRAANAARQLNYVGTIVYQHGGRIEMSRLYHLQDAHGESEKLSNLDGPAREIIRNDEQVRCYYPDAKVIRVESRSMHNAFPSLLPQQLATLATYYQFRKAEIARIAGLETQAYVFEPKDGSRYGHKLWADIATGLLLKARLLNERNEPVEQFAFSDIQIGVRLDRDATKPTFATVPADWQVRESPAADIAPRETGWTVRDMPPGFTKIVEGYRTLRGKAAQVAHIVYSDGLVAISVFVEPTPATPQPVGLSHQGGINVYSRQLDDYLVTVLGEAPGATVRQIAYSVGRRQ
ncbi:MAG: MucB/RseB C-terminal domain-containing protein [Betaproteobacteria bacterium]